MSDCVAEEQKIEEKPVEDGVEPVLSDDEDDCEGYFLEPVGNNINMAEKIAEANKKLQEEADDDDEDRPRKVQFSEELINFEPTYYSDEDCTESARNSVISEEDEENKINQEGNSEEPKLVEEPKIDAVEEILEEKPEEETEDIIEELDEIDKAEEIIEEIPIDTGMEGNKLLLVLLPKEQNSSCESIIGEEICQKDFQFEKTETKLVKPKIARPKSAKKCCEMSKISPNLNYSLEKKPWQDRRNPALRFKDKLDKKEKKPNCEIKIEIRGRFAKKINIDDLSLESVRQGEELRRCCDRPKSSDWKKNEAGCSRPKTAPSKRTCAVIKTELPHYNGLRSEYGLSAEQLEERKQRTLEIQRQRKQEKLKERQDELRKRAENEQTFQQWLFNKSRKSFRKKSNKVTDTLTRSDVYIQTHASYAANRSVPYSVDYSLKKINHKKSFIKKNKTIIVEKLLDKASPHLKRSFNIYLGMRP